MFLVYQHILPVGVSYAVTGVLGNTVFILLSNPPSPSPLPSSLWLSVSLSLSYQRVLLIYFTGYFDDNPFAENSVAALWNNPCLDEPQSNGMPVLATISRAESDWLWSYLQANPVTELIIRRAGMVTQ